MIFRYTENVRKMSAIFRDKPMPTLDKAVYWVEYVMRHGGAHHLHSAAMRLTWYEYCSLDIFALFASILLFSIFICHYVSKLILKSIRHCYSLGKTKIKSS